MIVVRPVASALVVTAALIGLLWGFRSAVVDVLAWTFILLWPASLWMAVILTRASLRHPAEDLLAQEAETANLMTIACLLLAAVGVNVLAFRLSGLGTVLLATLLVLLLARPLFFLRGYYREKW